MMLFTKLLFQTTVNLKSGNTFILETFIRMFVIDSEKYNKQKS